MQQPPDPDEVIAALGRKYIWWDAVTGQHSQERIVAQVMNLGTYDDLLLLERLVDRARLVEVMQRAQPGWFSNRSWEFWRSRLTHHTGAAIVDTPPRRRFHEMDVEAERLEKSGRDRQ